MNRTIPVIDLFAGPGGLGEGFESYFWDHIKFRISLSIEKDRYAHETLFLRSFFRQFDEENVPSEYYLYLARKISKEQLFELYPLEVKRAVNQTWCAELGKISSDDVDIRIKDALCGAERWVLIGGPPCQAYSIAGRSRMARVWKDNPGLKRSDHRHYLYQEYLRIIAEHNPAVFVMENVKGILSASIDGAPLFTQILQDLEYPRQAVSSRNYKSDKLKYQLHSFVEPSQTGDIIELINNPKRFIIRSEQFGIPQKRHRVIIIGIRSDIDTAPSCLIPVVDQLTVTEAISDLPVRVSSISNRYKNAGNWSIVIMTTLDICEKASVPISNEVICCMKKHLIRLGRKTLYRKTARGNQVFSEFLGFVSDTALSEPCNHEARSHMPSDLQRYFFASCFAEINHRAPRLADFPKELLPEHKNVEEGVTGNKYADRFRVQLRDEPSTTITCHISKDGHYFIHPDPSQCRSLTVREAARLQTFPDNYHFEGPRTSQYIQVGNAVPPMLALQLADVVAGVLNGLGQNND